MNKEIDKIIILITKNKFKNIEYYRILSDKVSESFYIRMLEDFIKDEQSHLEILSNHFNQNEKNKELINKEYKSLMIDESVYEILVDITDINTNELKRYISFYMSNNKGVPFLYNIIRDTIYHLRGLYLIYLNIIPK